VKEGDIVRVVKPRPRMGGVFIDILNEMGWIEEIQELDGVAWAQIQTLKLDDGCGGCGGVPLDCLALEPAPEWHAAKARRDARFEKDRQEGLERTRRWNAHVAAVADKHGVSPDVAKKIHADLGRKDY
jgi:hypothetical protein